MKKYKLVSLALLFAISFTSCIDDDEGTDTPDFPEKNLGTVQANRVLLTFFLTGSPSTKKTYEFYDADGSGGAEPTINEEIMLMYPSGSTLSYDLEIQFFKDDTEVTGDIENLGTQYIVCYRGEDTRTLKFQNKNLDNNKDPLGTELRLSTADDRGTTNPSDGTGQIRVTLNFQENGKDGSCDAGFRIFEGTMNYRLN